MHKHTDTERLEALAESIATGAVTLNRYLWAEGSTVTMLHKGRGVDAGGDPRTLTIDALRDTLDDLIPE